MCVAVPHRVVGVHQTATGSSADIDANGKITRVDTSLLSDVKVGDFILVFRSQALRVVEEDEARQIRAALACVQKVMQGSEDKNQIDEAFSDLVENPAKLPPHLAAIVGKKVL